MLEATAKEQIKHSKVLEFSTKANTLAILEEKIQYANILPLFLFTVHAWQASQGEILKKLDQLPWSVQALIVRSSAIGEDDRSSSQAGHFASVINVQGKTALVQAIETVICSYRDSFSSNHQILIQPFLKNVCISGVAFGRDPNTGSPYIIINYDDTTGLTNSVTSGQQSKSFVWHKNSPQMPTGFLQQAIYLLQELSCLFGTDELDIEFAVDQEQKFYLLQVRPLIIKEKFFDKENHHDFISRITDRLEIAHKRHPYLYGLRTVYGVMPDWNPAEIIGIRPRPLALSLYRDVITDSIWAYQRDNYGYNNLRSFPLLVDFEGLPYVDVRVSFNSFLPKGLSPDLAERLVNYYITRLVDQPVLHDKVEFDILFSCYTLDLKERLKVLKHYDFNDQDQEILFKEITLLTNRIIHNKNGLWKNDLDKVYELERRQQRLFTENLDFISKMYWTIEDCKRYGTLPFAGLARAGFIAVQLLKSLVAIGIISQDDYTNFFVSLDSIGSRISRDFHAQSREEFLLCYGHLRPGTYDILSLRYDEAPEIYFDWKNKKKSCSIKKPTDFSLNISQLRAIQEHIDRDQLDTSVLDLLEFIKIAIESREYAKFIFTRSISEFLKLLMQFAKEYGFTREDCSYLDIGVIQTLYRSATDPYKILWQSIKAGKEQYAVSQSITLPPLLSAREDAWYFHYPETMPNFITQKKCEGHTVFADSPKEMLMNGILFIPSADPGFDWIFSYQIAGFITQFGGVNSHMAIRAGELGVPAVIGAGEINYRQWSSAKYLRLDAANRQVFIL